MFLADAELSRALPPTILLVDDNPKALESIEALLRAAGAEVVSTFSPFGATNMVRHHKPDVVVLDVMMPGLSGAGLGMVIRKESDVPIVYFSAMTEEALRDLAVQTPRASYVLKSEGAPYLIMEIGRWLRMTRKRTGHIASIP